MKRARRKHDRQRERLHRRVIGTPPQEPAAPLEFQALDGTNVVLPPFFAPKLESRLMGFGSHGGDDDDDEHWLERRDDGRWYEITEARYCELEAGLPQGEDDE